MTEWVPLKRAAQLRYGDALPSESRRAGNVSVVGSGGVSGTHDMANASGPAIVVGRKGSYGAVHWASDDSFVIDTAYVIDRRMSRADIRWLYYVLSSVDLKGASQDVGVPGLSRDAAHSVLIPEPPSHERQRRIVDFLDIETTRIDSLVKLTRAQLNLMDRGLTEFARKMTTTGGSKALGPSGIAWMPQVCESWRLHRIGRTFRTGSGTTPRSNDPGYFDGEYAWVNTGDLRDSTINQTRKSVTGKALREFSALRMYSPGALVVAMYGATTGRVGILEIAGCVNQACCVLYGSHDLRVKYVFHWFTSHRSDPNPRVAGRHAPADDDRCPPDLG